MKKIGIIISLASIMIPAYATTMCANNNTVAVVLDPTIGGIGHSYGTGTWSVIFTYGTIYGISACINHSGQYGLAESMLKDTNNNITNIVVGSETYGNKCWCKMTHPKISKWVYVGQANCSSCSNACGGNIKVYADMRKSLFD